MGPSSEPTPNRLSPAIGRARGSPGPEIDPSLPRTVRLVDGRQVGVASTRPVDDRIRSIAKHQRGRVGRRQLLAAGVDSSAIKRRLRSGRLEEIHRGVYGTPDTAEVPFAAEIAALLACGEGALLSHHSAATLWQLRSGVARPVHVTLVRDGPGRKLTGVEVHRSRTITAPDVRVHQGLPVTSPARALLDVAATLTDRDLERLLDEGLFARRILTLEQVRDVLLRAGGHPGRARLARSAGRYGDAKRTESPPEEKLLSLIRAAGLPEPRTQVPVLGYRLDFFWPDLNLAVEVDAYGTHGSRARFEADRRRDARLLTEKGIIVLRVTKLAVETRPLEVIAMLARAIAHREGERGAA